MCVLTKCSGTDLVCKHGSNCVYTQQFQHNVIWLSGPIEVEELAFESENYYFGMHK